MTGKKTKWTPEQKLKAKQLRIAANPNITAQQNGQQQVGAGYDLTTDPSPQSRVSLQSRATWHAETKVSTEQQAAEVARVRIETKAAYDALKAQGLSTNKIMSQLFPGKTGHTFHAAKMVVQSEKNKDRAAEFKKLFPEIPNMPDNLSRSGQNMLLKAAGSKNKTEMKEELAKRRAAQGHHAIDDEESVIPGPTQGSKKRKHKEDCSVEQPRGYARHSFINKKVADLQCE